MRNRFLVLSLIALTAVQMAACTAVLSGGSADETEVERLAKVTVMASGARADALRTYSSDPEVQAYCEQALKDLLADNRAFRPLEPFRVLKDFEPYGGPYEWCGPVDVHGDEELARRVFQGFDELAGGTPFRLYHLPRSIDPFPEADLFAFASAAEHKRADYSWIDTRKCEYVAAMTSPAEGDAKDQSDSASAVAEYRTQMVVISSSQRGRTQLERYTSSPRKRLICSWPTKGR